NHDEKSDRKVAAEHSTCKDYGNSLNTSSSDCCNRRIITSNSPDETVRGGDIMMWSPATPSALPLMAYTIRPNSKAFSNMRFAKCKAGSNGCFVDLSFTNSMAHIRPTPRTSPT